ncbi:MAG: hypothetical protein QOH95_1159 [Gaiellaceae bacterium]|nr:hypothetical protein [Gaiellaceae bacterium]
MLLLATAILTGFGCTGCGGSSKPQASADWQTVRGPGFSFQAPAGWKLERAKNRLSATRDTELVQVAVFPLQKPYDGKLFDRVARELRVRMRQLAGQTGGRLSGERTVTADGIRSHAYDVEAGDHLDEYTFVLSGLREYLLLCRRSSSGEAEPCGRLVESFARL